MLKKELRLNYLQSRKNTPPEVLANASLAISNGILKMPIWSFEFYHLFIAITEQGEIDTGPVLSVLQGKDKNVVIPKVTGDRSMTHFLLTDSTIFKKNRWNIPEPVGGLEVSPKKIDVVFVPLLAFDKRGHRVGYGKGFYDVFLKECRPEALKIGLSIFEAEETITDISEEDIPLNYCVTPEKIYSF